MFAKLGLCEHPKSTGSALWPPWAEIGRIRRRRGERPPDGSRSDSQGLLLGCVFPFFSFLQSFVSHFTRAVTPFGKQFALMTSSDLLLIDHSGKIVAGGKPDRQFYNSLVPRVVAVRTCKKSIPDNARY